MVSVTATMATAARAATCRTTTSASTDRVTYSLTAQTPSEDTSVLAEKVNKRSKLKTYLANAQVIFLARWIFRQWATHFVMYRKKVWKSCKL